MGKFAKEVVEAVQVVSKRAHEVNDVVITEGYNNDLFDAASDLYSAVGNLIQTLEENDENMDPERTKLPNLDKVFENDPVTDYVSAVIALATGNGKPEAVIAAAKKLEAHQNGIKPEVVKEYPNTVQGCIERISDELELEGEEAADFQKQLGFGINMLNSRPGARCEFVGVTKNGNIEGNLSKYGSVITITVNGKEYSFYEDFKEKVEEKPYDGFCCEYPTEPVADDEELFNATHKPEPTKHLGEGLHISEYITKYGFGDMDPNYVMDVIQNILDRRTDEFAPTDYALIRFYLKQKPFNDPAEIDTLSHRALELAWKQFKYARKFM